MLQVYPSWKSPLRILLLNLICFDIEFLVSEIWKKQFAPKKFLKDGTNFHEHCLDDNFAF